MTTVTITPAGFMGYLVQFPYDQSLVALIKALPSYERSWCPSTKAWTIETLAWKNYFVHAVREAGHTVKDGQATYTGRKTRPAAADSSRVLWAEALFSAVGPARADAVYKALTKVLHPDLPTGDTQLMQALNAARNGDSGRRAA